MAFWQSSDNFPNVTTALFCVSIETGVNRRPAKLTAQFHSVPRLERYSAVPPLARTVWQVQQVFMTHFLTKHRENRVCTYRLYLLFNYDSCSPLLFSKILSIFTAESRGFNNAQQKACLDLPVNMIHISIRTVRPETAELAVVTGRKLTCEIKCPSSILHYQFCQSYCKAIRRRGWWYDISKYLVTDMSALKLGHCSVNSGSQDYKYLSRSQLSAAQTNYFPL